MGGVTKRRRDIKNPLRLFRMVYNSAVSVLIGMHYAFVGLWFEFASYAIVATTGHILFGVFWWKWSVFVRVCCYGANGASQQDYERGGACNDETSQMYRSGARGVCGTLPLGLTLMITFAMLCYGGCFCVWFFRYKHYMRHVYMMIGGVLELVVANQHDHGLVHGFKSAVRRVQWIPDTGLYFGRHERYQIHGGHYRQRVLVMVMQTLTTAIFGVCAVLNWHWGCYTEFSWGLYGSYEMLGWGMCTYRGAESFDGFISGIKDGTGIFSMVWRRTWETMGACVLSWVYWGLLVGTRWGGVRVNGHTFVERYDDAYVHDVQVYVEMERHLADDDKNPILAVMLHATGHGEDEESAAATV